MSLKVDKSASDIQRKCIKHAVHHVCETLSMVFNQSLIQVSKVIPIDKGGEEIDPFNYRPISTLSVLTILQIDSNMYRKEIAFHQRKQLSLNLRKLKYGVM